MARKLGSLEVSILGLGCVAYSPLGRGFLSGRITSPEELEAGDRRRSHPRFTGENMRANLRWPRSPKRRQ